MQRYCRVCSAPQYAVGLRQTAQQRFSPIKGNLLADQLGNGLFPYADAKRMAREYSRMTGKHHIVIVLSKVGLCQHCMAYYRSPRKQRRIYYA